ELPKTHQKLVADIIPAKITVTGLQRVLQNLVNERVSIRDLQTVLEGVAEATGFTNNITLITEHVRARLARQICDQYANKEGVVPLATLAPKWEQAFAESLIGQGEDKQLAMPPSQLQEFIQSIRKNYENLAMKGETPVLLTSPPIRPYVRSIIERFRPQTTVISQNEIHPRAKIRTVAQID
ncbi:MAG: FHIPEP family type III secretion protein, partial [Alphaproteobacteria bacterium]|nr:FHIPEP family type III secretion protein [Alphaproteobacteria bacterium]